MNRQWMNRQWIEWIDKLTCNWVMLCGGQLHDTLSLDYSQFQHKGKYGNLDDNSHNLNYSTLKLLQAA